MSELTHLRNGHPEMVDVCEKPATAREAVAEAHIYLPPQAQKAIQEGSSKGDVLIIAELAGIMAAKRTSELIPLCHPIALTHVSIQSEVTEHGVRLLATARTSAQTGVEMEALTAVSVAALTVYDMLKSLSKGITIQQIRLLRKQGGKTGEWNAEPSLNI